MRGSAWPFGSIRSGGRKARRPALGPPTTCSTPTGRAIGVVEAKPAGYPLRGVEPQSKQYTDGLPEGIPNYRLPLPFAYESTGKITHFTNGLDPDHRSREVFTFHRPEELKRLVELQCQLRSNLREMPVLEPGRLWPVQREAITNLDWSLAANRPRALIQMATGSGKTYTACSFCYRLIKFGKAKRILFLVDRNNLARQTLNEFPAVRQPPDERLFHKRIRRSAPERKRHRPR